MDLLDLFRALLALGFVLGLIGLGFWLLKRSGLRIPGSGPPGGRLEILEVRPLDGRRKLMLVRRDDVEHLLLLGTTSECVVEHNIKRGMKR